MPVSLLRDAGPKTMAPQQYCNPACCRMEAWWTQETSASEQGLVAKVLSERSILEILEIPKSSKSMEKQRESDHCLEILENYGDGAGEISGRGVGKGAAFCFFPSKPPLQHPGQHSLGHPESPLHFPALLWVSPRLLSAAGLLGRMAL